MDRPASVAALTRYDAERRPRSQSVARAARQSRCSRVSVSNVASAVRKTTARNRRDRHPGGMSLLDAAYDPDGMMMHPRHQAMQPVLARLIQQLRDCETAEAGVDFQRDLLARVLDVEKDRVTDSIG